MKRIFSIIMAASILLTLSACESEPASGSAVSEMSSDIVSSQETSSIETSSEEPAPEVQNTEIKLTFAGDTILASQKDVTSAGSFYSYAEKKEPSYFLEKVKPVFEQDDFTVLNLENVLSDRELEPVYKDYDPAYWFKSKASNIDILTAGSVEAVSLNNNHIMDYGEDGFNDTVAAAKNAGLMVSTKYDTLYLEKDGIRLAVISVGIWSKWSTTDAVRRLDAAKEASDYQIIFFHGGTEMLHAPDDFKVEAAHTLVDNGADLVVGSHPHVLQPREVYNGVEIVYSIGNFCYGGSRRPENATVIYRISLTFDEDKALVSSSSEIIPCYVYTGSVNNYQPALVEDEADRKKILDFMEGLTESPV